MELGIEGNNEIPTCIKEVGTRIKQIADLATNKKGFAQSAGLKEAQLYTYINGSSIPGLKVLYNLANAAGVSFSWLATGEGRMEKGAMSLQNSLDTDLLVDIFQLIEKYMQNYDHEGRAKAAQLMYSYCLRKRSERADNSKNTADLVDFMEVLKIANSR